MTFKTKEVVAFFKGIEKEGLIIDRDITGAAFARKFNCSTMEGKQAVDWYLTSQYRGA